MAAMLRHVALAVTVMIRRLVSKGLLQARADLHAPKWTLSSTSQHGVATSKKRAGSEGGGAVMASQAVAWTAAVAYSTWT
jgi:hypothetical protein